MNMTVYICVRTNNSSTITNNLLNFIIVLAINDDSLFLSLSLSVIYKYIF